MHAVSLELIAERLGGWPVGQVAGLLDDVAGVHVDEAAGVAVLFDRELAAAIRAAFGAEAAARPFDEMHAGQILRHSRGRAAA